MRPNISLARRLALPLSLSLVAHGLLLWLISCVQRSGPAEAVDGESHPGCSITLVSLDEPRPEPEFQPVAVAPAPDLHDAPATPPANSSSAPSGPISPAQQGTTNPTAGPAGSGASRGLLNPPVTAHRVVYLVDRSISMGPSGALAAARREVVASLRQLPPNVLFQVIPYNRLAEPLVFNGKRGMVPAEPALIEQAIALLADVRAGGATDHARALRAALLLRPYPDVIFLVTDADDLNPADVPVLARINEGGAVLQVIELSCNQAGPVDGPLARLALSTGGSYRRVPPHP